MISKSITHYTKYGKEFVHILQTSEVWSQLANTFGREVNEKRIGGENLPGIIHARKFQRQTLSEPLSRIMLYYAAHHSNSKHALGLGRPGSQHLLTKTDDVRTDVFKMCTAN